MNPPKVKVGLVQLGNPWTWAYYDPAFQGRWVRVALLMHPHGYLLRANHLGINCHMRFVTGDLLDVAAACADMIAR